MSHLLALAFRNTAEIFLSRRMLLTTTTTLQTPNHSHTNDGGHANDSETHSEEHVQNHEMLPEGIIPPPAWAVTPFVLLLGAIAILPLIPSLAHWWEKNSSKLLDSWNPRWFHTGLLSIHSHRIC